MLLDTNKKQKNNTKISLIVPAYNESSVISSCLQSCLENNFLDENQVIVVCNACKDDTANIVKQLSPKIICLETEIPSKTNALNMGETIARFYPRIYLDADIAISIAAMYAMAQTLTQENVFATSIEPEMDFSDCSWLVRSYYEFWLQLPYCKEGMIGSGVYALSESGRARFNQFPEIIADDGFVRCLFTESERPVTKGFYAKVKAPKDLLNLIKITTRSRLGYYELKEKYPQLITNEKKDYQSACQDLITHYNLWLKAFIYLSVNLICRVRAKHQFISKKTRWERDDSNRS